MKDKSMITVKETKGKYIFWDIDGTLAGYRFNGHLASPDGSENGMSVEEIEEGVFLKRKPSLHMQKVLSTCKAKQNIILGHICNEKEIEDKKKWLKKHFPNITEILFIPMEELKHDRILKYCQDRKIDVDKVIFVHDILTILRQAERAGITSYHISSFFDWDYQDALRGVK